jgi:hypothetical protein
VVSDPTSVPEFELACGAAAANFYPVKVIHERLPMDADRPGNRNVTTAATAPAYVDRHRTHRS